MLILKEFQIIWREDDFYNSLPTMECMEMADEDGKQVEVVQHQIVYFHLIRVSTLGNGNFTVGLLISSLT